MLKELEKKQKKIFPILLTEEEKIEIQKRADLFTKGNIGAWLRYAGLKYLPRKIEIKGK